MTTADETSVSPPVVLVDDPDGYMESYGHIQVCEKVSTPEEAEAFLDREFPRSDIDEDTIHICDGKQVWMHVTTPANEANDEGEGWTECPEGTPGAVRFWVISIGCANG